MVISTDVISAAIDTAPAWAKIGLEVPSQRMREDARRELAEHVYRALLGPTGRPQAQLTLPL